MFRHMLTGMLTLVVAHSLLADDLGDAEQIAPGDDPQLGKLFDEIKRTLEPHWSL